MISRYDVIKALKVAQEKGDDIPFHLSPDEKLLLKNTTNEPISTLDDYVSYLRKKLHCDFESIYYDHASLTDVYRCRQCGTVIFGGDDEDHYDPNEKCPTCCGDESVCQNDYWTKEEIDSDPEKQKTIKSLEEFTAHERRHHERMKLRDGLRDWERWRKIIKTKKYKYMVEHICFGFDGDQGRVPKGVRADRFLEIYKIDEEGIRVKHNRIPLNLHTFWITYIYKYTKACSPYLRKYHRWQKRPLTDAFFYEGQIVWSNYYLPGIMKDPVKMKVFYAEKHHDDNKFHFEAKAVHYDHILGFCNADWGKAVFTTRKAAKQAALRRR